MKIQLKLPDGGEFSFERPPMEPKHFEALCWIIGIVAVLWFFVKFFSMFL